MSDDEPTNAAKVLAEITGRPVSDFDASEYETPDFREQESEPEPDAICPGCQTVLSGSREPGDRDYCQEAEREVTLAPVNKSTNAHHVTPYDGESEFPTEREAIRGAIRKSRNGERVPVEMPLSHPDGYRFPKPSVVVQTRK